MKSHANKNLARTANQASHYTLPQDGYIAWSPSNKNAVLITYIVDTSDSQFNQHQRRVHFRDYILQDGDGSVEIGDSCYLINYPFPLSKLFKQLSPFLALRDRLVVMRVLSPAVIRHDKNVVDWFYRLDR